MKLKPIRRPMSGYQTTTDILKETPNRGRRSNTAACVTNWLRNMALRTAHAVPMAGHLGRKMTQNRLLSRPFLLARVVLGRGRTVQVVSGMPEGSMAQKAPSSVNSDACDRSSIYQSRNRSGRTVTEDEDRT